MTDPGPRLYQTVYRLLDQATPLREDCGRFCGKVCCRSHGPETGIYLLPGEEVMFSGKEDWLIWSEHLVQDYDFPNTWKGKVFFLQCNGNCPRENRPFQCRSFPLTAHYRPDGRAVLIWETLDLPYRCPLLGGGFPLEQEFVEAAAAAWNLLLRNPLVSDLVLLDSHQREKAARKTKRLGWPSVRGGAPLLRIVKVLNFGTRA